ncbi:MAG: VanZ family protein [Clostridiaceae bacterium]|nr:VanZ family protein [Clostridiaceae bacterium]
MFNRKHLIFLLLTIIWTGFIFYQSSLTGDMSGDLSDSIVYVIQGALSYLHIEADPLQLGALIRKLAHFFEFFILGVLLYNTFASRGRKESAVKIKTQYGGLFIACCDELIQVYSQGRSSSILDVFIDFSGVIFSLLVIIFIRGLRKKR